MSKVKTSTFTVMHDKGEDVNGVNVRPYETFQAVMTPELKQKVDKGFLVVGTLAKAARASKTGKRATKKSGSRSNKR